MDDAQAAGATHDPVRMATLTLLADRDYLALARTSASHVAALLFFPRPRVSDLRLAVDEACTSFLRSESPGAAAAAVGDGADGVDGVDGVDGTEALDDADGAAVASAETLELRYDRHPSSLHVTVSGRAPRDWPERDELGWAMLSALVGDVQVSVQDGVGALTLIVPLPTSADGD